MMSYTFLPEWAKNYKCPLSHIRESWKQYPKDNKLKPHQVPRDGVHLNEHGEFLPAELVNQELVYRPQLPQDEWKDMVKTYVNVRSFSAGDNLHSIRNASHPFGRMMASLCTGISLSSPCHTRFTTAPCGTCTIT